MERTIQRAFQQTREQEAELLRVLSEQTSAEKSSAKTTADVRMLRSAFEAEERRIAGR